VDESGPFYSQGKSPRYPLYRRLFGLRTNMDAIAKRKYTVIAPRRELNPGEVDENEGMFAIFVSFMFFSAVKIIFEIN
jgi:hypothetical protein